MNFRNENPPVLFQLFRRLEFSHSPLEISPSDTSQWIRQEFPKRNMPELQPQISRPLTRILDCAHPFPIGGACDYREKTSDRNNKRNRQPLLGGFHQRET